MHSYKFCFYTVSLFRAVHNTPSVNVASSSFYRFSMHPFECFLLLTFFLIRIMVLFLKSIVFEWSSFKFNQWLLFSVNYLMLLFFYLVINVSGSFPCKIFKMHSLFWKCSYKFTICIISANYFYIVSESLGTYANHREVYVHHLSRPATGYGFYILFAVLIKIRLMVHFSCKFCRSVCKRFVLKKWYKIKFKKTVCGSPV